MESNKGYEKSKATFVRLRSLSFAVYNNKCISDFANAPSEFFVALRTSDMPNPLGVIMISGTPSAQVS